ncbi:uracil phosphoribosyltransferase-domain-containing protein, partial [Aspergillus floccosus]
MENLNGNDVHTPTKSLEAITILDQDASLLHLMTIIRNANTDHRDFCSAVEKVVRRLVSTALNHIPIEPYTITTPVNTTYRGVRFTKGVCGVSILRAGTSMEQILRETWMGPLRFGKLLIQRDETTCRAEIYYCKLPHQITNDVVLLLEPMLATGGSVIKAVEALKAHGVAEDSIVLVNVISSQPGLDVVSQKYPYMKIVLAAVDQELNPKKYISPGLGDFGDRYYGTC